ncbi:NXPE family member 3-like isoform X2 [Syngnathoides biaculeatus]|uniref:NXPE family member 3-like isoform X2 n=1 Tax=Syngnathoides biaculeatus TaxID=300417 RepID=UPI002ADDE8A4|nr:NXPE family member 3-like isoform X2 [Syngnathoides biaculeatus]
MPLPRSPAFGSTPAPENWRNHILAPPSEVQNWIQSSNLTGGLPAFTRSRSFCLHPDQPPSPEEELEERELLDSIDWPQPPPGSEPPTWSQTSDPAHSLFTIVPSKNGQGWYVGDQLEAVVRLHDFEGRPKRYGGDLLLARLRNAKYKAGVAGQVLDHENGLYSARFPLLWEGSAQVGLTLVHSSEAVAVLRRMREKRPDRVYFSSVFRRGNRSEKTECNVFLPRDRGPLCNLTDPRSGAPWYCYKPKTLNCDARYSHSMGGYAKNLISKKEALLFKRGKNVIVPIRASTTDTINVLPARTGSSSRQTDPVMLATSGYYYQDSWRPLGGVPMGRFDGASAITRCLTGMLVYMYGDSTLRQWFEYLLSVLPDVKKVNLENPKKSGPFMAVDSVHNILLEYRFHGPPIRIQPVMVSELRYIANELDGLTGGPNTAVVLGIWAHFGTFPLEVYVQRLRHIRKAVLRLLDRAPGTAVVIRTANPQEPRRAGSLYNNEWLMLQQDAVLRRMFKHVNVMWVDAWQMCLAHRLPHNLHPPRAIVKDMVDMMLSYVCRNGTRNYPYS